ncbi:MAG: hypothetical protein QG570_757 [Patescibacteria group bacterium]|nr:hypothetical protein [Patescibacteria group bacterium]
MSTTTYITSKFTSNFYILFLVVILFTMVVKLTTYLTIGTHYSYDETIIKAISTQTISGILNSIRAEPHPPGMYIFLHFLPTSNIILTRIIISCISLTIWVTACLLIFKKTREQGLILGLTLFTATYFFASIIDTLKHPSLTLPICLLSIAISSRNGSYKTLVMINLLLLSLVLSGYLPYLITLVIITTVLLQQKSYNHIKITLIVNTVFCIVSLILWTWDQIFYNLTRFTWIAQNDKTIYQLFMKVFSIYNGNVISEILFLALTAAVISQMYIVIKSKNIHPYWNYLISFFFISIVLGYAFSLNVRVRFNPLFILSFFILSGYGLLKIPLRYAYLAVLLVTLSLSAISFIELEKNEQFYLAKLNNSLSQHTEPNLQYKLIAYPDLKPYVHIEKPITTNVNIIPTNIITDFSTKHGIFDRRVIASEGQLDKFLSSPNEEQVRTFEKFVTQNKDFDGFILLLEKTNGDQRQFLLINLFEKYCKTESMETLNYAASIVFYNECGISVQEK